MLCKITTYHSSQNHRSRHENKLSRLKISADDLTAAFAKIDDWMSEFYAVAKIGLDENPQLLEALGKMVR
ncbi:hypothetical protein [uncultured Cyclobacterium sp.]|uniref:hypothetical protein n=1 Tax=uncultured Cyclobacterium sp. TaxID=453820 RepID=UPI0030ED62A5